MEYILATMAVAVLTSLQLQENELMLACVHLDGLVVTVQTKVDRSILTQTCVDEITPLHILLYHSDKK